LVEKIIKFCEKNNFELLITADHGNCDEMWTIEDPKTAHTLNNVPCRYIKKSIVQKIKKNGWLEDIAPTALKIMWIEIPKDMTGKVLI
jgi:2,3-bisphosphoglycerate-independent phosphoglycerate mutase